MTDTFDKPATATARTSMQELRALLHKYWRICGTGIGFLAFGIGALSLRLLIFPLINLAVRHQQQRIAWSRTAIRWAFRSLIELMCMLRVISYDISGLERLQRRGLLILANHPTLIDTMLLMAFVRHADCIVKSALWNNPVTRGPVRAAGYISNAQGPLLVEDCIASLRSGGNLIIFPEGTRTPLDGNMSFKRGAANVAVRGNWSVTPVTIRCAPILLSKGKKWWKVPPTTPHFSIAVRPDIDIAQMTDAAANPALAARQLTHYLQHYFMKES
jgi:1-acyl-sn-glycerol-3-phosphate acyltransferase